ncbi:MAG TPA: prolipoprotein diacylglyceryl transferase [Myxococcaceae bacterium]|nr:prolipoprotein diacylglyceryl transferase [Myxococcaceae bacterium]
MLPTLIQIDFDTPFARWAAYLLAVVFLCYGIWAGWRNAPGRMDRKSGKELPPTREERTQRAALYGVLFAVVLYLGLRYALPPAAFPGGKGEGLPLHTYGLMLMAGFVAAIMVSARLSEREWVGAEGVQRRNDVMDLAVWVVVSSFVGSKILFILVTPQEFLDSLGSVFRDPSRLFGALGGGFVFYGGLIGAAAAVWWFCRERKINFLRFADVIAPTVALGQAFGRLGCFAAGCCWGKPATVHVPWAVRFPMQSLDVFGHHVSGAIAASVQSQELNRWVIASTGQVFDHPVPGAMRISDWVAQHGTTLPIHPTQLYESLAQLLLFVALMIARRYRRFHGQILALYLIGYAIIRTTVELFRGDFERGTLHKLVEQIPLDAWWNISTSQLISLVMFALGVTLLVRRSAESRALASASGAQPV